MPEIGGESRRFTREDVQDAVEAASKAAFEKALTEFLKSHPEQSSTLNEGIVRWVVEHQINVRRAMNITHPQNVTPAQMYFAVLNTVEGLMNTPTVLIAKGHSITSYLPFALGLVQVIKENDSRQETYRVSPTDEARQLYESCFPGREKDKRHAHVAIVGDILNPRRPPGERRKSSGQSQK